MDISTWFKNGKRTETGLIVAPENFVLEKDVNLFGTNRIITMHAGKEFFTSEEAEALQWQSCFPEGWRLPTVAEGQAWLEEFLDESSVNPSSNIVAKLRLKLGGFVYPDMSIYNMAPTDREIVASLVVDKMIKGRFWLMNDDGTNNYTYSLAVYMTKKPEIRKFNRSCGHSIRLVHD